MRVARLTSAQRGSVRLARGLATHHGRAVPSYLPAGAAAAALAGISAFYGRSPDPVVLLRVERTSVDGASLTVTECGGRRWLSLGDTVQSIALVDGDWRAMLTHAEEWTQLITVFADAWLRRRAAMGAGSVSEPSALLLGVGGAVIARSLLALHASLSLHCVELEPEFLDASQRHFELRLDDRCSASVLDAALFVKGCVSQGTSVGDGKEMGGIAAGGRQWDVVVVDCFTEAGLAPSVADGQLLRHLAACLGPGGLCLINTTWSTERGATAREVAAALTSHFGAVYLLEASTCRNVVVLCHQGSTLDAAQWRRILETALPTSMCPDVSIAGCLQHLERR